MWNYASSPLWKKNLIFFPENEKSSKKKPSHQTNEEALLKEVMERSRQEFEKDKGKRKEIERMEKTLALSKEESERCVFYWSYARFPTISQVRDSAPEMAGNRSYLGAT